MSNLEDNGAVKFAKVDATAASTTELVAAVTGRRIRILGLVVTADAAATATFKSNTTALSGALSMPADGVIEQSSPWGLMETAAGEALNVTLAGTGAVAGWLSYQEID